LQWISTFSQGVKTGWSKDTKPQIVHDEDDQIVTTEKKHRLAIRI